MSNLCGLRIASSIIVGLVVCIDRAIIEVYKGDDE